MTRIDWLILRRMLGRIIITVLVFFSLMLLVESLDTWRFQYLSKNGGPGLAIYAIIGAAARWSIKTLIVTVLIGAILGLLDLQARRELTIIKASGISIWRVLRAPVLAIVLIGLVVTFIGERATTDMNRGITVRRPGEAGVLTTAGELWLEQSNGQQGYILKAGATRRRGTVLEDVTVFMIGAEDGERLLATDAILGDGEWTLNNVQRLRINQPVEQLPNLKLATTSTIADLGMKTRSPEDFTFYDLASALSGNITDPAVRAAAAMRYFRILSQPLLLAGAMFIAFAFTAGYRRTNQYGTTVLYGLVLGFVVFVLTEMADRAGAAGVLDPAVAALGPALVAIIVGATVLLHKEDGRA